MFRNYRAMLRQEFRGYGKKDLMRDCMAGLTVCAVALPLALAFGVSSGADAASGLITAIVAGLIISALSGGYYQISGPTGAMAAILMSIVAKHGMQGVFIATFLAGAILLLAGLFKLGRLTAFIPAPVITGFTSGIAVIIALGQVDNFFGVSSQGANALEKLASYASLGFRPDWTAVLIGVFVILFMIFFPKKLSAVVPASLIAIILTTAAAMLLKLDVASVGAIPKTLFPESRLSLSALEIGQVGALISPAVSIAMLGMIESLLCGASAGRMTGKKLDANQELIAQGIGNLALPFFGGIPATAAIARTSVAIKSGARTRLTGVFHAVGLLLAMFVLGPVMSRIPLSALAGVLMVTAWRMNEWESIRYMFSHRFKGAILKFFATMLATIVFDLTVAILVGVVLGLVLMVRRQSKLQIRYEKVDMARAHIDDAHLCRRYEQSMVAYVMGPILFATTEHIEAIPSHLEGCDTLLLSMRGVSYMDVSGAQCLMETLEKLKGAGVDVALCGVNQPVMEMIERSGIAQSMGRENFYWSVSHALVDARPVPELRGQP